MGMSMLSSSLTGSGGYGYKRRSRYSGYKKRTFGRRPSYKRASYGGKRRRYARKRKSIDGVSLGKKFSLDYSGLGDTRVYAQYEYHKGSYSASGQWQNPTRVPRISVKARNEYPVYYMYVKAQKTVSRTDVTSETYYSGALVDDPAIQKTITPQDEAGVKKGAWFQIPYRTYKVMAHGKFWTTVSYIGATAGLFPQSVADMAALGADAKFKRNSACEFHMLNGPRSDADKATMQNSIEKVPFNHGDLCKRKRIYGYSSANQVLLRDQVGN